MARKVFDRILTPFDGAWLVLDCGVKFEDAELLRLVSSIRATPDSKLLSGPIEVAFRAPKKSRSKTVFRPSRAAFRMASLHSSRTF